MISLYKCEKCGKVFSEYAECDKCERTHYSFHNRVSWQNEGLAEQLDGMAEYKEGIEEPDKIVVWFEREYWNEDTKEWVNETRCGKYKLVSSFEKPLVIAE